MPQTPDKQQWMHQPEAVEVYDDILTNCFRQAAMDSLQTTVGQDTVMDSLLPLLDEQFDLAEHPMSSVVVDQHFELSAEIQAAEQCAMPKSTDVPAGRMADYLHSLFEIGDTNDDGVLSPDEFTKLLSRSGFNFPDGVIAALVTAADVNEDGVVEYDEFVPAMLAALEWSSELAEVVTEEIVDQHFEYNPMPQSCDIPAGRMADYLHSLFEIGDTNDDGVLSPVEFTKLLSRSGFNFPDNVIAALVKAADVNEDGVIEYSEFVPAMLGVISMMNSGISNAADCNSLLPLLDEHFDLAKHPMSSVVEQSTHVAAATKVNSVELPATISASIAAKKQTLRVTLPLPLHAPGL